MSSRVEQKINDDVYRFYVTNALKILTGNTAKFAGGTELTKSYYDILHSEEIEEDAKEQKREAQDVVNRITNALAKVRG